MAIAAHTNLPLCSHRYAMVVSYLGTKYFGSQRLNHRKSIENVENTVQEALECSLEQFLPKHRCVLTGASRTDRGVHALMNCFTLPLMDFSIPTERIKHQCNRYLISRSHDINVKEVILVPADFHPRKRSESREYIYRLSVPKRYRSQNFGLSKHNPEELFSMLPVTELFRLLPLPYFNYEKALEAIDLLRGEHDFASFSKGIPSEDTTRHLEITISHRDMEVIDQTSSSDWTVYQLHFKSRAFLYNQIRRIVGSIISYASYRLCELIDIRYLLDKADPDKWDSKMKIAEPWGLYLSKINFEKNAFEGSIKTYENNVKEEVDFYPALEKSDDREQKCEQHVKQGA